MPTVLAWSSPTARPIALGPTRSRCTNRNCRFARAGSRPRSNYRLPAACGTQRRTRGDSASSSIDWFSRIVFNILVSNTDDHARNHAAFWDGKALTLTPAYDLCPSVRTGDTATQAMGIDRSHNRASRLGLCVAASDIYQVPGHEARDIIDAMIETIDAEWNDAADEAELTSAERDRLWRRQFLNPAIHYEDWA